MIIRKVKVTEYEYQAPINYVAGATEPDIQFQLTDYEIPSGATGRVYVGRSDGTFEYTVATISGNTVTVAPTSSMFSVKGAGAIQVTLYVGNEVVKNFAVPVYVHADLADDSAEAGSDVTGVFRAAEEQALADFAEDAEAKAAEVIESIPADYTELTEDVSELNERIDNLNPITDDIKEALLACFEHVAWIDDHGMDYYNALENALYPLASISVVYTQSGKVYATDLLDSLKSDLVVTAINHDSSQYTVPASEYTLSGTLVMGTSTITVTYKNKTATFTVNVTDLRIVYEIDPDTDLTGRAIDTGVPVFGENASFTILVNTDLAIVQSNKTSAYLLNHKSMSKGTIRLGFDNNNNLLHFITNVMYSDYYAEQYTPGDISPSVTHNVVWIVRMDNQYVRKILYVDNNKLVDRSESISSYVNDKEFTGNYLVGGNLNTTNLNYTWPGSVNMFRIYDVALDNSEIESIMNLTL